MSFSISTWSFSIPEDAIIIALIALALATFALSIMVATLSRKVNRLLVGENATSLEDSLKNITKITDEHARFKDEITAYLVTVEERLRQSIQKVGITRFDAFKGRGGGGGQSFATTLLNERGDGIMLSSIQFRDHVGIYAKPIEGYSSELELSAEEKEALGNAKEQARKKHVK